MDNLDYPKDLIDWNDPMENKFHSPEPKCTEIGHVLNIGTNYCKYCGKVLKPKA